MRPFVEVPQFHAPLWQLSPSSLASAHKAPSKGPQMTPERPQRVPWPYHLSGSGFVGASWLPVR